MGMTTRGQPLLTAAERAPGIELPERERGNLPAEMDATRAGEPALEAVSPG